MSVFNGAAALPLTLDSVLNQTYQNFEVLVVNDGSTDESLEILRRYERQDHRVRVINQANQGLTRSLNTACREARGLYIARQDVGDVSLPDRFRKQSALLQEAPDVVAVGCGARRVTVEGEYLGESTRDCSPQIITEELVKHGIGLIHPASMIRTKTLRQVGGYREQFRFAQDTDLWLRLVEHGMLAESPDPLFQLVVETDGISALQIDRQRKLWEIARECRTARLQGKSEEALLEKAVMISSEQSSILSHSQQRLQHQRAAYFIGSQLLALRNKRCRRYFSKSLASPSLAIPSIAKLLQSLVRCPSS
ncbi:cellulose synthase/poly-beta-1,6-N-acetylglucosamine synthase-like glycosyltransferase [Rhodopirellula rubra]|uniref:Cellulose synthase/poly-beta-1,6-N-acetylglucosamine synthase-like glycosyltransferase n=2 Tax=Aporhodopirellula rubra TaxID=980271 RepID=A0A7W5DXE6_9BACT|nr:cellulose synthase/poly-beta-1,6-N-acetylglucosamine synthase-like glycosyltransferase [Aporhodopirellula rubra]